MKILLTKSAKIISSIVFINLAFANNSHAATAKVTTKKLDLVTKKQCHKNKCDRLIAQTEQPNRDRFIQPDRELIRPEDREPKPILPEDKPTVIPESDTKGDDIKIPIDKIKVVGSTVLADEEIQSIVKPLEGKEVKLSALRNAAKAITKKYLDRGYITSRAIVPQQEIKDGIVEIKVIEGSVGEIKIEGDNRLRENFVRQRLELGTNTPLKVDELEGQLQLLRSNQTIKNVEANLQPAPGEGESSLVVEIEEASPWLYGAEINNYSTVATGAERISLTLGHRNLTGNSDRLVGVFTQALSASSFSFDTSYSLPVNPKDGTVQLRARINRNEIITEEFEDFGLEGDSELYEVSFRQPLIRTLPKEFALSLGFSFQESRDFANGVRLSETNRTSVVKFGQDYTKRDIKGVWALRSQFNLGFDSSDEPDETDALLPNQENPDDVFVSWLGQAQRLQRISPNNLLIMQADVQLTPSNLSPSEQFVIGGAQSVRGYRQNARLGESGLRFSVEDRITVLKNAEDAPLLQVAPFADLGLVAGESTHDTDDNLLAGVGLGLIIQPVAGLDIRLDYAPPLVNLEDTDNNLQEDGFYFRIGYRN